MKRVRPHEMWPVSTNNDTSRQQQCGFLKFVIPNAFDG